MKEITTSQLYKMIQEAQEKAFEEHINANMIIINENLIKVPQFIYGANIGGFPHTYSFPPMICGMEVQVTKDDLPKNVSFSLVKGSRQIDKIISDECNEAVKNFAEFLISQMDERDYMGGTYKQGVFNDADINDFVKKFLGEAVEE